MDLKRDEANDEEDPFWKIALHHVDNNGKNTVDDDDTSDAFGEENEAVGGKVTKYLLPNTSIVLELAPLAAEDGIWSPVGDHAWYSSALLASMILCSAHGDASFTEDNASESNDHLKFCNKSSILGCIPLRTEQSSFRILELGSGAVGLSGIAFAVAISQKKERFPSWTITLTDNDTSLLKQLEANVRSNILSKNIVVSASDDSGELSNTGNQILVDYLDWDIGMEPDMNCAEKGLQRQRRDDILKADIVIGSELAYTHETATALVKVLLALLDKNPRVQIWIVQVTDRYGWSEIVVPAMESRENIRIERIPLTYDIHDMAATMITMGGALDRFAFGAFRISNYDCK